MGKKNLCSCVKDPGDPESGRKEVVTSLDQRTSLQSCAISVTLLLFSLSSPLRALQALPANLAHQLLLRGWKRSWLLTCTLKKETPPANPHPFHQKSVRTRLQHPSPPSRPRSPPGIANSCSKLLSGLVGSPGQSLAFQAELLLL